MMQSETPSVAEVRLARAVLSALEGVPVGGTILLEPTSVICSCLERYIPETLASEYAEWTGESLDGIFTAQAINEGRSTLRLLGTCILITDQTVTPLQARLQVAPNADSLRSLEISVGELGGGALGISGPPCNSGQAARLLHGLQNRIELEGVDWVYSVIRHENENGTESHSTPPLSDK
jgi:hypothetical protein